MKRTIRTKVISIENEEGETPRIILQCPEGETMAPKDTVTASAIMRDQEPLIAAADRINILGKGRAGVKVGDTVEVHVISDPTPEP